MRHSSPKTLKNSKILPDGWKSRSWRRKWTRLRRVKAFYSNRICFLVSTLALVDRLPGGTKPTRHPKGRIHNTRKTSTTAAAATSTASPVTSRMTTTRQPRQRITVKSSKQPSITTTEASWSSTQPSTSSSKAIHRHRTTMSTKSSATTEDPLIKTQKNLELDNDKVIEIWLLWNLKGQPFFRWWICRQTTRYNWTRRSKKREKSCRKICEKKRNEWPWVGWSISRENQFSGIFRRRGQRNGAGWRGQDRRRTVRNGWRSKEKGTRAVHEAVSAQYKWSLQIS